MTDWVGPNARVVMEQIGWTASPNATTLNAYIGPYFPPDQFDPEEWLNRPGDEWLPVCKALGAAGVMNQEPVIHGCLGEHYELWGYESDE